MYKSTFEEEIMTNGSLCYTVSGVSMLPLLHQHKDIVIIKRPVGRLKKYDIAFYKTDSGKYILHRVLKVRKDDYVICGDNCIRREYGITDNHIIGVMESFVRSGKTHSMDSTTYLIYSHLIVDLYYIKAVMLWVKLMVKKCIRKVWRIVKRRGAEGA